MHFLSGSVHFSGSAKFQKLACDQKFKFAVTGKIFSGFSVGCCIERLSVTNLSSENNFADVSTECSSRHQGESGRSAKQRCYL